MTSRTELENIERLNSLYSLLRIHVERQQQAKRDYEKTYDMLHGPYITIKQETTLIRNLRKRIEYMKRQTCP